MRPLVRPALDGIELTVDLFDADLHEASGDALLIVSAILPEQVDFFWNRYVLRHEATLPASLQTERSSP